MKNRIVLPLTLAALAGLALAAAPAAHAGPVSGLAPHVGAAAGGAHFGWGVGVGFPVGPVAVGHRHHRHPPAPVVVPSGHWELREERIWVPGTLVGYDVYGYPVHSAGYWTVETTRVWVPDPVRYYPLADYPYGGYPYSRYHAPYARPVTQPYAGVGVGVRFR